MNGCNGDGGHVVSGWLQQQARVTQEFLSVWFFRFVWPTIPAVRLPRLGCSPAPLKLPRRRFGSCSLKGAPVGPLSILACDERFLPLVLVLAFNGLDVLDFLAM